MGYSPGLKRVRCNGVTNTHTHTHLLYGACWAHRMLLMKWKEAAHPFTFQEVNSH